jgi:hypothetical protein
MFSSALSFSSFLYLDSLSALTLFAEYRNRGKKGNLSLSQTDLNHDPGCTNHEELIQGAQIILEWN